MISPTVRMKLIHLIFLVLEISLENLNEDATSNDFQEKQQCIYLRQINEATLSGSKQGYTMEQED